MNGVESLILLFLVLLLPGGPVAAEETTSQDFEVPPVLMAGEVTPGHLLSGPHHRVLPEVHNDGFLNLYRIETDWGEMAAYSNIQLAIRVHELTALVELDQMSTSDVFVQIAAGRIVRPIAELFGFFEHPVSWVRGLPSGVMRIFTRRIRHVQTSVDSVQAAMVELKEQQRKGKKDRDSAAGEPEAAAVEEEAIEKRESLLEELSARWLGVSRAHREWSKRLGTDPYTTNPVLREAIRQVSWADRIANRLVPRLPVPYVQDLAYLNEVIWDLDAYELRKLNTRRLLTAGADPESIELFFDDTIYTPSQQTIIVTSLIQGLDGVAERDELLPQALDVQTEVEAAYYTRCVVLAAWYHRNQVPLQEFLPGTVVPVALTKEQKLVVVLPVDYVFWTEPIAIWSENNQEDRESFLADRPELEIQGTELWLTGNISDRARRELTEEGWKIYANLGELLRYKKPGGVDQSTSSSPK